MRSQRSLVLPLLMVSLLAGLWLCYGTLGRGGQESDAFGLEDEVFAGGAEDRLLPNSDLVGGAGSNGSGGGRTALASEVVIDEEAAALAAAAEARAGTQLTGTIVRGNGLAVAGARVLARRSQRWLSLPADLEPMESMGSQGKSYEAVTDEAGRFVLIDVPACKLAMSVRSAGLAPLTRTDLEIPVHENFDLGRFQLELGIRLSGQVVGQNSKGVEGVQILSAVSPESGSSRLELPGRGIPLTMTNADGRFEVDCMAPGSWHLLFDAPGYRIAELKGRTEPAGNSDPSLLIRLETGLSIEGRVVGISSLEGTRMRVTARRDDEQPSGAADDIEGAELHRARHGDVGADGAFLISGLPAGVQYKLRLYQQKVPKLPAADSPNSPGILDEDDDEDGLQRWRSVQGVEDVVVMSGAKQVEFKYRQEAIITLLVKSAKSGSPLSRFYVHVDGEDMSGDGLLKDDKEEPLESHPGGVVRYERLQPPEEGSSITVRIRAEGFEDFEKKGLMLRPGATLDLGECALEPAPTGLVKVLDETTGEPIQGARVVFSKAADAKNLEYWAKMEENQPLLNSKIRAALTNEKGIAELTLWKGSVNVFRAVAEGYQMGEEGRQVPPFSKTVETKLVRGGKITVVVSDAAGRPVAGMFVEHKIDDKNDNNRRYWDPDSGQENKTGDNGQVVFLNLPEGKHSFSVLEKENPWGDGGESAGHEATGDVFLKESEERELILRVESRGGLLATLLESGEPLIGALVKLSPVEGNSNENMWYWGGGQEDPRSKISDHTGRAKFTGIKVGRYNLRISHADRRMVVSREVLVTTEPEDLIIDLGLAVIEGRVLDAQGVGIRGVSITVYEQDSSRRNYDMNDYRVRITEDEDGDADWNMDQVKQWAINTDQDGRFELRGVAPECELVVNASNAYVIGATKPAGPLGGDEYLTPFDFVLERAGCLQVDSPGMDRNMRNKMSVVMTRMEGTEEKETTTSRLRSWRGNMTMNSLRAGTWRLKLMQDKVEEPLHERMVTIEINQTTTVTLNL